jgi:hypothetical protein
MPAAKTPEQKREAVEAKIVRKESERPTRSKRPSFNGTQGKLKVNHNIEGYHLHIFNDEPGRIEQALGVGYEFVSPDEVGGTATNVVSRNTDIGDKVRFLVGTSANAAPQYAYLMKIKQEFNEEDQAALQIKNDAVDDAIRGGRLTKDGHSTEGFYTPREGIKMSRS